MTYMETNMSKMVTGTCNMVDKALADAEFKKYKEDTDKFILRMIEIGNGIIKELQTLNK